MSTSALSNETLSYTYTTVPIHSPIMVGYSESNNTLLTTMPASNVQPFNVLSITIANPGVYLCEGNIGYNNQNDSSTLWGSLSTISATFNTDNQVVAGITSFTGGDIFNTQITTVITITTANTTLYCVGKIRKGGTDPLITFISDGFIKYTRIA